MLEGEVSVGASLEVDLRFDGFVTLCFIRAESLTGSSKLVIDYITNEYPISFENDPKPLTFYS